MVANGEPKYQYDSNRTHYRNYNEFDFTNIHVWAKMDNPRFTSQPGVSATSETRISLLLNNPAFDVGVFQTNNLLIGNPDFYLSENGIGVSTSSIGFLPNVNIEIGWREGLEIYTEYSSPLATLDDEYRNEYGSGYYVSWEFNGDPLAVTLEVGAFAVVNSHPGDTTVENQTGFYIRTERVVQTLGLFVVGLFAPEIAPTLYPTLLAPSN